jgi:uncharacterized membrane protein
MMTHLGSFSNQQNLLVLIELNSSYLTSSLSNERESSFMAFLIVLNNKESDFLMGLLLFFISNNTLFPFKFPKDYLVVIIEELTICIAIEMQHS